MIAVPEIILHVQMDRVRAGLPDLVEPLVAAPKRAQVRQVAIEKHRPHHFELREAVRVLQIDPHESKARVADLGGAQPGGQNALVADRMVVRGVLLAAELGHRLADGFAEPDPQPDGLVVLGVPDHDLHAAVQLLAEIQQNAGLAALVVSQHARIRGIQRHLPAPPNQQRLRILHALAAIPHHPRRQHIPPNPRVRLHRRGRNTAPHQQQVDHNEGSSTRPHGCLPIRASHRRAESRHSAGGLTGLWRIARIIRTQCRLVDLSSRGYTCGSEWFPHRLPLRRMDMNTPLRFLFALLLVPCIRPQVLCAEPNSAPLNAEQLYEQFREPGAEYRGKPFWAWNGELSKDELIRQIHVHEGDGVRRVLHALADRAGHRVPGRRVVRAGQRLCRMRRRGSGWRRGCTTKTAGPRARPAGW